jgi:hypothetical protein
MSATVIIAGQRFHSLTATGRRGQGQQGRAAYEFVCDCGRSVFYQSWVVLNDKRFSCGCRWRASIGEQVTKHGRSGSPEYRSWQAMKSRCFRVKDKSFAEYGGRGISVCEAWSTSFEAFFADMGPRPQGTTIERIDNDGPYCPSNCRWAPGERQARNKRNSRKVVLHGVEMPLADACERSGVPYMRAYDRLRAGWPVERALSL